MTFNLTLSFTSILYPVSNQNAIKFEWFIPTWITSCVNIAVSSLCLCRYFRSKTQQTFLNYIYYCSLGFSYLLSLVSVPLHTVTDSFWSSSSFFSEQQRNLLCNFNLILLYLSSAGIGYSIAYASLERTIFIFFYPNLRLSIARQSIPILSIVSFCCFIITLSVLLTRESFECFFCLSRIYQWIRLQYIWLCFQCLIPLSLMLLAIIYLLYMIEVHSKRLRLALSRERSRRKFQRTLIHLTIYHCYYLISVGPLNIFGFIRHSIHSQSNLADIIVFEYTYVVLNCYPIAIYFLERVKQKRRINYAQEQKQTPFVITSFPAFHADEYQRTRL